MKLGQNIGEILLDIAQTSIQKGNPEKAVKTYTDSLHGFTEDYVIKLLRNEYVLVLALDDEISVELTDSEAERSSNQKNIIDWSAWLKSNLDNIFETIKALNGIRNEFEKSIHWNILDYNIAEPVIEAFGFALSKEVGVHNIAARLIAGYGFANLYSNGENVWRELCSKVENGDGDKYQIALYCIVNYVDNIRILHKEYMQFIHSCAFLLKNKLAERPPFIESKIEAILDKLTEFADARFGYHHPLCDSKLYEYKEKLDDEILSTDFGKEFRRYGIIEKNIMDGYDAGWLSPEGKFYGTNGSASSMIHLRIAEKLKSKTTNGDEELEKAGWMKIHGNEVYGTFIGNLIPTKDFPYQYCPTDTQIKLICAYIDKFYDGKFYHQPQIVKVTTPINTYKFRQMDKFKLHELFSI